MSDDTRTPPPPPPAPDADGAGQSDDWTFDDLVEALLNAQDEANQHEWATPYLRARDAAWSRVRDAYNAERNRANAAEQERDDAISDLQHYKAQAAKTNGAIRARIAAAEAKAREAEAAQDALADAIRDARANGDEASVKRNLRWGIYFKGVLVTACVSEKTARAIAAVHQHGPCDVRRLPSTPDGEIEDLKAHVAAAEAARDAAVGRAAELEGLLAEASAWLDPTLQPERFNLRRSVSKLQGRILDALAAPPAGAKEQP